MNRRGFLQTCLALAAAPAIVRADSLMRIVARDTKIIMPELKIVDLSLPPNTGDYTASVYVRVMDDTKLRITGGNWSTTVLPRGWTRVSWQAENLATAKQGIDSITQQVTQAMDKPTIIAPDGLQYTQATWMPQVEHTPRVSSGYAHNLFVDSKSLEQRADLAISNPPFTRRKHG